MAVAEEPLLPFIDAHDVQVDAAPEVVWATLVAVLPRAFGGPGAERFARAVGCADARHDGDFPTRGAHVVGFHVKTSDPPSLLVLQGRHRFAVYRLTFRLEPAAGGTRVTAESHARFPGLRGALYRTAVIGTRGHVLVVRRLLRTVRRRAEREAGGSTRSGQPS